MSWYRMRVERDLVRWQSSGWVSEPGAAAIRADLAARRPAFSAAAVLALLGAVLFGFAVMSFVAAHWSAMSKLARLLLLLATLWACYGAAAWLFARRLEAFAHAAVLGGIAVYGASIMLIAQMYHMDGNPADAVLLWAAGALLAALLLRSHPALAAAFVLFTAWTCMQRELDDPHWAFLVAWLAAAGIAGWLAWRPGLHLAALSLAIWLVPLGYLVLGKHAHWLVAGIGVAVALLSAAAAAAIDRWTRASQPVFAYAVAVAFIGLFMLHFLDDVGWGAGRSLTRMSIGQFAGLAGLTLVLLVTAMSWALRTDNRGALWVAYAAFGVEIIGIYGRMLGTLLNTSLFFLIAALIVSALAWAAYHLHRRQSPATEVAA
jgi:uncharacterized membrane protein